MKSVTSFVVPALLVALVPLRAADETTALPAAACASLQGLAIAGSAIGLPTSGAEVQSAAIALLRDDTQRRAGQRR